MKRIVPLALLIAASLPAAAVAESEYEPVPFYRVEVIVFTHAGGESDRHRTEALADFSDRLDPLRQRALARGEGSRNDDAEDDPGDELPEPGPLPRAALAWLERLHARLNEVHEARYPRPWLALESGSEEIEQAWRRLRRSSGYHTLARLAWHQPLDPDQPPVPVRIHDGQPIAADWQDPRENDNADWLLHIHYRLDGSFRLRQHQYMHADFDLVWREQSTPRIETLPVMLARPDEYLVHRLNQSRTVRPGRIEYFDSAWLGALVLISEFEPDEPQWPHPLVER